MYNHSFAQACILHGNHSFSGEQCGPWTSCLAILKYEKLLIWPKFLSTEICLSDSLKHEIFTLNLKGLFVLICLSGQTLRYMRQESRVNQGHKIKWLLGFIICFLSYTAQPVSLSPLINSLQRMFYSLKSSFWMLLEQSIDLFRYIHTHTLTWAIYRTDCKE